MLIGKLPRVRALAGRFDLDVSDQRFASGHGEVRPGGQRRQCYLTYETDRGRRITGNLREFLEQRFQRIAKLILRSPRHGRAREFGLRVGPVVGHR